MSERGRFPFAIQGATTMMFKFSAGAIALAALTIPAATRADDGITYEDLVHCAATSLVVAQVLDTKDGQNKETVDTMNSQAAALMTFASLLSKKDTDTVFADTQHVEKSIVTILSDDTTSSTFIKEEIPRCKTLGQAAVEVINEKKSGK